MGFDSLVRGAVSLANRLTSTLQTTVTHEAWISQTSKGKATYAEARQLPAIVDMAPTKLRLPDGNVVSIEATVTIVGPVAPDGAPDRREPIDPRDRITLPNGYVGQIVSVRGLVDPGTRGPYMLVVSIG